MGVFKDSFLGALGSGIVSLVGGLFGSSQNAQHQKDIETMKTEAQSKENEKAFERNKELAALFNQYNIEQWERENAYNTPLEQAKRLKAAGLNPDLVVNGLGGIAAKSPTLQAGSPYQPVDMASIGNAAAAQANAMSNALNSTAQTISNAMGQDAQTAYFNSVKNIRKQLEQGQLNMQGVEIDLLNFDLNELKPQEKQKLIRQIQLFEKQAAHYDEVIKEVRAKTALLNAQEKAQILDNLFNEATLDDRIATVGMNYAKLVFDTQVSQQQAKYYGAYMLAQIWNLNSSAALNSTKNEIAKVEKEIAEKTKKNKIDFENGKLEFDIAYNNVKKDNAEVLFYIETGIEVVEGITGAANLWKSMLGKPKKEPRHKTTRTEKSDGTWSQTDIYDN